MKNMMTVSLVALGFLTVSGVVRAENLRSCPLGYTQCESDESCCVKNPSDCSNCQSHVIPLAGFTEGTVGALPSGAMFTCSGGKSPQKSMIILQKEGEPTEIWTCAAGVDESKE